MRAFPSAVLVLVRVLRKGEEDPTTVVTVVTAAAGPTSGSRSGSTSGAVRVEVVGKGRGVVGVVGVVLLVGVFI